jgi:putative spermidine/putrescine transport system substrate-binding protein
MIPTTSGSPDGALTRRRWLQRIAASVGIAIGGTAVWGVPTVWAQNIKNVTLRQFGTGVSNIDEISRKAKEDLGFTLTMTALDSDAVVQRAVT